MYRICSRPVTFRQIAAIWQLFRPERDHSSFFSGCIKRRQFALKLALRFVFVGDKLSVSA
jgi:hypothetical protein